MPNLHTTNADVRDWTIYKITSPSGRVYVGITFDLQKRFKYYRGHNCKSQRLLHHSLIKYGFDSHTTDVIDTFRSDYNYALGKEMFWIRSYMCNYSKFKEQRGMNLCDGGVGSIGRVMSEEAKQRLREVNTGKKASAETRAKLSKRMKGSKMPKRSEEYKKRMSEAKRLNPHKHTDDAKRRIGDASKGNKHNLGRKQSKETIEKRVSKLRGKPCDKNCAPIIRMNSMGGIVTLYKSVQEASKMTGVPRLRIIDVCKGRIKSANGYFFKYKKAS
jgi:group I intron endonuclease